MTPRRRPAARVAAAIAVVGMLASLAVVSAGTRDVARAGSPGGMRVLGSIPLGARSATPPLTATDSRRHLAYLLDGATLRVYNTAATALDTRNCDASSPPVCPFEDGLLTRGLGGTATDGTPKNGIDIPFNQTFGGVNLRGDNVLAHVPVVDENGGWVFFVITHGNPDTSVPPSNPTSGCQANYLLAFDGNRAATFLRAGQDPPQSVWQPYLLPCVAVGAAGSGGPVGTQSTAVQPGVLSPPLVKGLSYDPASRKLLAVVEPAGPANLLPGVYAVGVENARRYKQLTFVWQLDCVPPDPAKDTRCPQDPATNALRLDWQVNTTQRCDTFTNAGGDLFARPIVARVANAVLSYCYVGGQGRSVVIPLDARGAPKPDATGNPEIDVAPTIGGTTSPFVDRGSGRLLIQMDSEPLGPAIYVFDPIAQRFLGVIPSGVASVFEGKPYDLYRGFDPVTGRAYVINRLGIVMASVRADPLPGGLTSTAYTATSPPGGAGLRLIGTDGTLRRLFVPDTDHDRFVVVEDDFPEPPRPLVQDPDRGTANIPEAKGATASVFSGDGNAFAAHVIAVGGTTNAIDNLDPVCVAPSLAGFYRDDRGRCTADRYLTSGNREYFVARTALELGSESGTVAAASAAQTSSNDSATDADLRSIGQCGVDKVPSQVDPSLHPSQLVRPGSVVIPAFGPLGSGPGGTARNTLQGLVDTLVATVRGQDPRPVPVAGADTARAAAGTGCGGWKASTQDFTQRGDCGSSQFPDPAKTAVHAACVNPPADYQNGTRDGFPSRESICTDFSGTPAPASNTDAVGTSSVSCDFAGSHTVARAGAAPGAFLDLGRQLGRAPLPPGVGISVADSSSSVETVLTDSGIVTTSQATLTGVQIGPFTIGRIHSEVRTVAHGRAGTTSATYRREISAFSGPGASCNETDCSAQAQQLADAFNQFFQGRAVMRLAQPALTATPKGFQAVAGKEPGLELSDAVVNDDDTKTFNALDILVIDDTSPIPQSGAAVSAGKSRAVIGLAGVQAEATYGVIPLAVFNPVVGASPEPSPTAVAPAPSFINPTPVLAQTATASQDFLEGGEPAQALPVVASQPPGGLPGFLTNPLQALRNGFRWIVTHPGEFALLFLVWSMLATPVYLAVRRRMLAETIGFDG